MFMKSIREFDDNFHVKTFYTDKNDIYDDRYTNIFSFLGVSDSPIRVVRALQTHSANVYVADVSGGNIEHTDETYTFTREGGYDSIVTKEPGILLMIRTADCTPVYMYDKKSGAIAMVHSGWRGTIGHIAVNTVNVMKRLYGAKTENIQVAIGPCICKNCYEVGSDLYEMFRERFDKDIIDAVFEKRYDRNEDNKYSLDVKGTVILDLIRNAYIPRENITDTCICTYESPDLASYRRCGRMDPDAQMMSGIMRILV